MYCSQSSNMDFLSYCKSLPKIELHAHLTGSLSDETVLRLLEAKRKEGAVNLPESAELTIQRGHNRTLEECFKLFGILHCLTDNLEAVKKITRDVIREFVSDNVRYLELRTTPKFIPDKMTKKDYIDTVLDTMIEEMKTNNIIVRLLLSIDRSRGVDDARNTVQLAKDYTTHEIYKTLICGIDVSGNPQSGKLTDYICVLEEAKKCGFRLAVHLAEIPSEEETLAVLKANIVDRIGHGTFIHLASGGSQELLDLVKHYQIPLEVCVSSNVKSGTVKNVQDHHLGLWRKEDHPLVICTDDKGIFSTSLSEEYCICAETFDLSKSDLIKMCISAVESTFLSHHEKHQLRLSIQDELNSLKGANNSFSGTD
ncbi:adenosine deaminase-like protein [Homarus americanus]|uniref:Adenosine deaminase-like protein n=1 Tax=Homarus americanus TaxID=6706 RepID=A0A8J5K4S1_HOMAM|nr:adenosine deaminase-like protein [Homarus americanus]KAG7167534.1 Adenosine deaminase-like 2 [Homarus americanus]